MPQAGFAYICVELVRRRPVRDIDASELCRDGACASHEGGRADGLCARASAARLRSMSDAALDIAPGCPRLPLPPLTRFVQKESVAWRADVVCLQGKSGVSGVCEEDLGGAFEKGTSSQESTRLLANGTGACSLELLDLPLAGKCHPSHPAHVASPRTKHCHACTGGWGVNSASHYLPCYSGAATRRGDTRNNRRQRGLMTRVVVNGLLCLGHISATSRLYLTARNRVRNVAHIRSVVGRYGLGAPKKCGPHPLERRGQPVYIRRVAKRSHQSIANQWGWAAC